MKICILGAGTQGIPCASILSTKTYVDKIFLIDINKRNLIKAQTFINNKKLIICNMDCNNIVELMELLKPCEVCMDFLTPNYAPLVMNAAVKTNTNYINTAYDFPFWGNIINNEPIHLDKEFKENNLVALLGCGNSPGFVNIYIKKYCDKLDEIDYIKIYGAYEPTESNLIEGWNPGWSLKQAYLDYISSPCVYRNGKYLFYPPFSEIEKVNFPNYGKRSVALHSHEEAYSLPFSLQKGIKCCEFKYEVDEKAACFFACGFRNDIIINIGNEACSAVDLLIKTLEQGNTICDEEILDYSTIFEISGLSKGSTVKHRILLPPLYYDRKKIMSLFNTVNIDVALPAVIGMELLPSLKRGVCFAENISPVMFEQTLHNYIEYKEIELYGE